MKNKIMMSVTPSIILPIFINMMNKDKSMMNKIMIMSKKNIWLMIMSLLILWMISKSKGSNFFSMEKDKSTEMYLYSLMTMSSMAVFSMNDSMAFFIIFEVTMIPMMIILLNFSKEKEKIKALFYMIVTNMMFSMPFLTFILLNKVNNETMSYSTISMSCLSYSSILNSILMMAMLITKYPMFLTHMWLTKAHVEASTSGSMMLAGILLKLGSMGVEINMTTLENSLKKLNMVTKNISLIGLMLTSFMIMRSTDMKKMAAIFSISHMAMVLINTTSMKSLAMEASKMLMISHGFISSLMFMIIGMKYEKKNNRSTLINTNYESINKTMSTLWMLTMFSNIGIPPMMNVTSELIMFNMMLKENLFSFIPLSFYMIVSMMNNMMFLTKNNMKKTNNLNKTKHNVMVALTSTLVCSSLLCLSNSTF